MLTYNTRRKTLVLPEYGRSIQKMVDHCLTLENREERTACAHTIVKTMATLMPDPQSDKEEYRRKLWDHLAIMADFRLDIDWPYEVPQPEALEARPDKIPYPATHIRLRHYGRRLEQMLQKLAAMEPSQERDALVNMLANQMKKNLAVSGLDSVSDARVLKDLAEYTHGTINLRPEEYRLHEYEIVKPVTSKKKRRK